MCPEDLPQPPVTPLVEQVQIEVTKGGPMTVRVIEGGTGRPRAAVDGLQAVPGGGGVERRFPQATRVHLVHRYPVQDVAARGRAGDQEVHLAGPRSQGADQAVVTTEQGMGVVVPAL